MTNAARSTIALACISVVAATLHASADFDRWSSEVEDDPFSGGKKVTVSQTTSMRSGVVLYCDTTEDGSEIRAVPGYIYEPKMADFKPQMQFAIDGKKLPLGSIAATVTIVSDNLAAIRARLTNSQAKRLAEAFASAKRQVALQDGMSDRPYLLRATGSTKSGQMLINCLAEQPAAEVAVQTTTFRLSNGDSNYDVFIAASSEAAARDGYKRRWGDVPNNVIVTEVTMIPRSATILKN